MIGKIYKITDTLGKNICYIGSTTKTLKKRFKRHIQRIKENRKGCTISKYLLNYGIKHFKIELLKEYQVEDEKHLRAYEQLWMNKLKCINKLSAFKILTNKNIIIKKNKLTNEEIKQRLKICREERKKKIDCACGSSVSIHHFARHKRTKKHLKFCDEI